MHPSPLRIRAGVSKYLFRLATEGIRLYSNRIGEINSLDETVNGIADRVLTIVADYGLSAIEEHFRIIPTEGNLSITLNMSNKSALAYEAAAELLTTLVSRRMALLDAVSLALYDLIAEQEVAQLAAKIGISSDSAAAYRKLIRQSESNVVPFR